MALLNACFQIWQSLRKHAYSNIHVLKILQHIRENFQIKNSDNIFYTPAQNIDCGYSLELPW